MPKEIDPQDLIALEEAQAKQAAANRFLRDTEVSDFRFLMASTQGRRFVWRLLDKAGVFRSTFRTTGEGDFLEGMRNMGLLLLNDIHEICPEKYYVMVREQQDHAKRTAS